MVATYHKQRVTLSELRRKVAISLKGTTLKSLMAIADTLGISTRPLRLDLDALHKLKPPAILHWDMAHYVVLIRTTSRYVEINDPAIGKRRLSWAEVSKHFTGVALELTPAPGFQKKSHVEKVCLSDLWTRARGFVPSIVQLLILSLVLQIFSLLSPMLNQMVIDDAVTKGDIDLLGILILGMALLALALALAQMGTTLLRGFVSMHFGTHLNFQMRGNLLRHLLRLPVPWFEKRGLGDILSRFGSLGPVQSLFTGGLIAVVLDGMMAVVTHGDAVAVTEPA
jgi:ATP-binding cassette, subfamily B, bacterial CvaB/MchF/RaxB